MYNQPVPCTIDGLIWIAPILSKSIPKSCLMLLFKNNEKVYETGDDELASMSCMSVDGST